MRYGIFDNRHWALSGSIVQVTSVLQSLLSKHADAIVVATVITLSVSETRQSTSLSVSFSDDALAGES